MASEMGELCNCGSGKEYLYCCKRKFEVPLVAPSSAESKQMWALFKAGRYVELESMADSLLGRYPNSGTVWEMFGLSLQMQGKNALQAFQKTAELMPDDAGAHYNLGLVLKNSGLLNDAVASYRRALRIKPDYVEAYNNLGNTLKDLGQFDDAMYSYRRALGIDPMCIEALLGVSHLHAINGEMREAEEGIKKVLEINPNDPEVCFLRAMIRKTQAGDENFSTLLVAEEKVRNRQVLMPKQKLIYMYFALGKCFDDLGDYDRAFPYFMEGNRLMRSSFEYDAAQMTRRVDEVIRIFNRATIERLRGVGNPSEVPIFVLGMQRSGTTLVEQIISSHPEVHGAGELPDMLTITQRDVAGARGFPGNIPALDCVTLTKWADDYVASLRKHAPDARHITDKMPNNFRVIGLIHLMLPNARIIHVNRNPVDTCLSCHTKLFSGMLYHTYDLAELGRYYVDYVRLMEHWRNTLPAGAFLDVQYEDIVADQETQTRRIIDFCGLDWNEACIDFHMNKRSVGTASMTQVRQPMYRSSVERWRTYEKHLAPLLAILGDTNRSKLVSGQLDT